MPSITDILPALYASLFPERLRVEVPDEKEATCGNCAMADPAAQVASVDGRKRAFRPDTKCCTYQPKLPNYRVGVSPLGLSPPSQYNLLYSNARDFFGKSPTMRCPFYRHNAGADGRKFWSSLKKVLSLSEIQLSRYAVLKLHRNFIL